MKKKFKKDLIEVAVIGAVLLILYVTGLLPEIMGLAQRGLLKTGLVNSLSEQTENDTTTNPAADFTLNLQDASGKQVSLKDFKGKVIFLNFWATWCPPCIAEMPDINHLYKSADKDKYVFLMVSMDDKFETAKAFRQKKGYDFPIYYMNGPLPEMYNSGNLPTTYLINSKGELTLTHIGIGDYNSKDFITYFQNLE